jgi:hypothetical protein
MRCAETKELRRAERPPPGPTLPPIVPARSIDGHHVDVPLGSVGVAAPARPGVVNALEPYESAVQLPIARALASADAASLIAVAEAAAP